MRLESSRPSETFTHIRHFIFVCDCGVTTDQIIAVPASDRSLGTTLRW
jgi:hypothetical protein